MMSFKEFTEWCYDRSCDGMWGIIGANDCIYVIRDVRKHKFFKERYWKKNYEKNIVDRYVNPINRRIESILSKIENKEMNSNGN